MLFVFQDALKWLPSASGLTEEKKQVIGRELRTVVQHIANSKQTDVSCCNQIKQPLLPICSYSKNPEILCASDCVELKFRPDMGRYIAARREIQPGGASLSANNPCSCYKILKTLIKDVEMIMS
jgi:hypothetical protein